MKRMQIGVMSDGSPYLLPPDKVDVAEIRNRVRTSRRWSAPLSQAEFALRYGFSLSSVQDWEQGRKQPTQAARILLTMISRDHKAVDRILRLPD